MDSFLNLYPVLNKIYTLLRLSIKMCVVVSEKQKQLCFVFGLLRACDGV